jgi:hypothetical protein
MLHLLRVIQADEFIASTVNDPVKKIQIGAADSIGIFSGISGVLVGFLVT